MAENTTSNFYTLSANDPQGDPISFAVAGGVDADKLVLDGTTLRFNRSPNFDLPIDQNGDNIYEIRLRATAGGQSVEMDFRATVTNLKEGVAVKRIARLGEPTVALSWSFDSEMLYAVTADGNVLLVNGADGSFGAAPGMDSFIPGDFLSAAYAGTGNQFTEGLYILSASPTNGLIVQLRRPGNPRTAVYSIDSYNGGQNVGSIFRGEQGSAVVAVGDTSGLRAQDSSAGIGKLYSNIGFDPYAGASVPETPTTGLRMIGDGIGHPGGGGLLFGRTFLADRGKSATEELNFFSLNSRPLDFGWPFYEGYTTIATSPPEIVNGPTLTYPRGDGARAGQGIVAGVYYDGPIEGIRNHYVFADTDGTIWSIPWSVLNDGFRHTVADVEVRTLDFTSDAGEIVSPKVIERTGSGTIYILGSQGDIYRVEAG